ncbi:tRNA-splicing endonuclease subunit Sen54 [Bagarius yarrelli]|uniref:tRNA-splicing endonuclease subunit Sen54 n=1 Tax=Bagarius yarrelli TaxID=175774 RepID=A0A556TVQ1_BAGYA|nr:tRNA-splicing endonuclease subunit Sen54 [Bagarius yarrelli]
MATNAIQSEPVRIDFCDELLSSSKLFQSRSRSHKIPVRGQKEFLPNDSERQKARLQKILDEHWTTVTEERVERVGNLVNAEWIPEKKIVTLQSRAGKFWQTMGFSDGGKQCLYPEEALYLMECGNVQVFYQDLPLSIQEGYESFLSAETVTYLQYQVFGHLKRLGYVVNRYNNRLCNKKSTASSEVSTGRHTGENKTNVQYSSLNYPGQIYRQIFQGKIPRSEPDSDGAPGRHWWTNITSKPQPDLFQPSVRCWDFSCIIFPDLGSHGADSACLPPPDPSLLPGALQVQECHMAHWCRNIDLQQEHSSKQTHSQNGRLCNINDDRMVHQCKNWDEYLKLVEERKSQQHNNRPTHLWKKEVLPLAYSRKCSSNRFYFILYDFCLLPPRLPDPEQWRIDFNLYQPDPEFKKSNPGKPSTRLCVCSFDGVVPDLRALQQLSFQSGDVPMTFAVVDHGDISFYSFKDFKLPTDVY